MTPQQLAQQTEESVALTLGRTTMKLVEAQTAADLLMAETEELRRLVGVNQAIGGLFVGLLAWLWLSGAF